MKRRGRTRAGNITGGLLGLLVFLGGLAVLAIALQQAWGLYNTPPAQALGIEKGKPLTVEDTVPNAAGIIIKILVLVVIAIIGSLIANRGIQMFADTRPRPPKKDEV